MLILGERTGTVAVFLDRANAIVLLLMEGISAFVPVFIFGSLFNMILGDHLSVLLKAYKVLPVMLLGHVFLMAVYAGSVCIRKKVSPTVFFPGLKILQQFQFFLPESTLPSLQGLQEK